MLTLPTLTPPGRAAQQVATQVWGGCLSRRPTDRYYLGMERSRAKVEVALLISVAIAPAIAIGAPADVSPALRTGSVLACQLSTTASLPFDGKAFAPKTSKESVRLQIRILREELEMTLTAPSGEIYAEKDLILSRTPDGRSLFAIYRAPAGNIVSLALHTMKNDVTLFTQSKTYQLGDSVYQSIASGQCHQL